MILNIFKGIRSILKIILFSKFSPSVRKIHSTKEGTCLIFGNGPSLKTMLDNSDWNWIKKHSIFGVNDISLSDKYVEIQPQYYIFADPGYWDLEVPYEMEITRIDVFRNINEKTNWKMSILIPEIACNYLRSIIHNDNITVYGYNVTTFSGGTFLKKKLYRCNLAMPHPQNVLIAAIYHAINIGFNEIYLFGADHSWLENIKVSDRNEVVLSNKHFYDKGDVSFTIFLKCTGEPYLLHEALIDFAKMFLSYHDLRLYADEMNCKIFNMTNNSFIDAFERKKI